MTENGANGRPPEVPRSTARFQEIPLAPAAPVAMDAEQEFAHLLEWIGEGVAAMERIEDEAVREQVFALLEGVDIAHRQALTILLELISSEGDRRLVDRIAEHPVVHALLEMYDLPEISERNRAEHALEGVYPYIESHGGHLELVGVENGRVRVRLSGSCGNCPGSDATLQRVVEEALREGMAGFTALESESPPPSGPVPIQLGPAMLRRPRWVNLGALNEFPEGEMRAVWPEGNRVLVVRLDGEVYAHRNGCPPESALGLHLGELDGATLTCPWHGCRYDIRTGKRLDAEGKLGVLPVAVKEGVVLVALGLEEVALP